MAQISDGDNNEANVELNLIPFIDLMCVCITFLLVTAVWAQVSMIQLGTSVYGQNSSDKKVTPPKPKDIVALRLDIKSRGFIVNIDRRVVKIPKIKNEYDYITLQEELSKVKERYPEKTDSVIAISDDLPYDLLIKGMDNLIEVGFSDIGIATGEVQ